MMPPLHTVTPDRRTRARVVEPLVVGAGRDDVAVKLGRGVEVVVVGGETGRSQGIGLFLREHAEGAAGLHAEPANGAHHVEHLIEGRAVGHVAPGRAHAEAGRPLRRAPVGPPPVSSSRGTSSVRATFVL